MHKMHILLGTGFEDLVNVANQWFKENPTIEIVNVSYRPVSEGSNGIAAYVIYKTSHRGGVKI